jgi:hypothetical protein
VIPLPSTAMLGAALAVVMALLSFWGGWQVNDWRHKAAEAEALAKALQARQIDEQRMEGVVVAYRQVASEMARLTSVNRIETIREIHLDPAYRCANPESGQRLLDHAADLANGHPVRTTRAVPGPAEAAGPRLGRGDPAGAGVGGAVRSVP